MIRDVVDGRFFVGSFNLENDGAQAVVAAAYGYAGLFDPVAVIKLSAAVRQGENILIDSLPRLITEPVRLGVVGVKDLPFLEHRTLADPLGAVFLGQFLIKMPLEDGDPTSFHVFLRGGVEKGTSGKLPPRDSPRRSRKPYSVPFAKVFEEEGGRFGGGNGQNSTESLTVTTTI